ncbi:predicted protein [Lichtheimia corymbifera JMRC:FSU:9682]|uniref:Uncharacterized protein n=1 Tax=Lichtheimia corymbifera JMRC:FSU:9682 TaxID=1263082 RepID=A0A068SG27_9FUNG|nr:predicted protein [Lichtheimia corymbifera JMRC:FSU:9682]CDH61313.1 predicted protein [Lichtheimia corymbifera JMRC:FSU:9682]
MTIADTEEPVSWLKQNPNRQSFASKPTYNKRISTMAAAAAVHGQEILPKDRRPVSPPWSNPPTANDRVSSMIMAPSPTPSTASSTPTSALRKADGNVQQFIPRLDLDLSPMTIHPRDTEDEEDENEDGDSSGLQSPTSIQYVSNDLMGRVQSLESELQTAYQHVHYLKAQLAQHDQSTQALVTKHIEEKESEKLRVKQLTELVHTQDLLIQQLQQRQQEQPATSSSGDSSMAQELSKLRADLDTLHFEKRSLETRMAAFLHEELDMSHVSLLSNDDDELFSVAMGYRSSTEQQPQDLLQHMDLRRRSSSIIDADQYSMTTFGNAPSHHHRSNSNSENRLCSPMGHITSNNTNNHATSPSSRYTNHSTLNLVEERDEEDDAVSRYSSLSSSPATMSFASPTSSSVSDPRYSILKSTQQMRTSLSSVSSTHLPAHGSPTTTTTNPSTAAAAANAARKAAWARIMIPPATPPPSHPLPPLPPNGGTFPLPAGDDTLDDDSDMDDTYPDPRQSDSPRKSTMHPPSVPPLAISTSTPSFQQQQDPGLSSAPPIMSPQRESLEAAMRKNGRESAATVHSSGTDETSSRESKQSFWKGVKTKWKRK